MIKVANKFDMVLQGLESQSHHLAHFNAKHTHNLSKKRQTKRLSSTHTQNNRLSASEHVRKSTAQAKPHTSKRLHASRTLRALRKSRKSSKSSKSSKLSKSRKSRKSSRLPALRVSTQQYCREVVTTNRVKRPCMHELFYGIQPLKASIEYGLTRNLKSMPHQRMVQTVAARKEAGLRVAGAVISVLKKTRMLHNLEETRQKVVVLGRLHDLLGIMLLKERNHADTSHMMVLATNNDDWSFDLNKDFVECAVDSHGFKDAHTSSPVIVVSTNFNILNAKDVRRKVAVTHCELEWIKTLHASAGASYKWQTYKTNATIQGQKTDVFVSILKQINKP